ncbi:MAG: LacI family DNA-binding transcriptional regulator [Lentisphaeria bacterium]
MNLTELSKELGYSVSVISRAMNPNPDRSCTISLATRQKIRRLASEFDFQRNYVASCVRKKRFASIGVFLPSFCRSLICDAVIGMSTISAEHNLSLNFYFGNNDDLLAFLQKVNQQENLGIIVYYHNSLRAEKESTQQLKNFCHKNGKVVLFNTDPGDTRFAEELATGQMAIIKFDDYDGGSKAGAYLHSLSCSDYLALSFMSPYFTERVRGFSDFFSSRQVPFTVEKLFIPSEHRSLDLQGIFSVLSRHRHCSKLGLFVPSDYYLLDCLSIAEELNFQVGRNLHIIGYDNCDFLTHINKEIASMEQNFNFAGCRAMQMMIEMLNGENVTSESLKTKLVCLCEKRCLND